MDELDEVSKIESRHRKEKKELQAHITAIKKAAKNDKSKKKELIAEVARLESELETKHKQELDGLKDQPTVTPEESCSSKENEVGKTKISKAQKRRDKKFLLEREREENIKFQEKENLHGPRNVESQAILSKLKDVNLELFSIPSDGDCLYKAISHQLDLKRQQKVSVEELRGKVSHYIRQHKDDFFPFMSNPDTYEMLTDVEFEEYCDKITDTKVWGGQLEIKALSSSLKCPINVIQSTGPDSIEQGTEFEGAPLVITYHRHMYGLGEHYNSTKEKESVDMNGT